LTALRRKIAHYIRKTLYEHSTGSKANYLELLQPFVEEQNELQVQKSKINEADSALAAIIEERAHTDAEYRRERLSELVEAERKGARPQRRCGQEPYREAGRNG
jgi:hemolysin D